MGFFYPKGDCRRTELTIIKKGKIQFVSARELHKGLEIKSRFDHWFSRMCEYGFIEGVDYKTLVGQKRPTNNPKNPITEYTDYAVTVDMAKQICMVQRNKKGMEYRRYLLEVERLYKEKQSVEYQQTRQKSICVRKLFTETLQEHGIDKNYEYINITRNMKKPLGITARKNDMTKQELKEVTASEYLAEAMLSNEFGYNEVNPVCIEASEIVRSAMTKRIAG